MAHRIQEFKTLIEENLKNLPFPAHPAQLYDPIRYFLNIGGKRIRPILVMLGAEVFKDEIEKDALPAALAVELFHNFTLMHDDIMDHADLRRGFDTVHKKWNPNVAILSGDNLMIYAYQALAKCPDQYVSELVKVFSEMAIGVCEGQQLDMDFEELQTLTQEDYFEMIEKKTSILLGAALKMGAIIGGANQDEQEALYRFGINLGLAFQIQDDLLDTYGNQNEVGKFIGGDIIENKKTILYIAAINQSNLEQKEELLKLYSTTQLNLDNNIKIQSVISIFDELNVKNTVQNLKNSCIERAYEDLKVLRVAENRLENLRNLAQTLLNRIH